MHQFLGKGDSLIDDSDNAKQRLATAPESSQDSGDAGKQADAESSQTSGEHSRDDNVRAEHTEGSVAAEDLSNGLGGSSEESADSAAVEPPEVAPSQGEEPQSEEPQSEKEPEDAVERADEASTADEADDDEIEEVEPLELIEESDESDEDVKMDWYILKVQVNRENTICDALQRNVKVKGLERYFGDILIPTEDVREFTKTGKQRVVKRKLYPGYILVNMAINDDTWFLVRETPGIGDFTGSIGKPTPMDPHDVERILATSKPPEEGEATPRIGIKFKPGDRVRVKEGYFQNFEGEVDTIDEANGRITVMINIFGRATPVELDHWQFEEV